MSSGFASLLTQPVFAGIRKRIARSLHYRSRQALACVCRNVLSLDDTNVVVRLTVHINIYETKKGIDEKMPYGYFDHCNDLSAIDICLPAIDDHDWLAAVKYSDCEEEIKDSLRDRFRARGILRFEMTTVGYKVLTAASPTTRALALDVGVDRTPRYEMFTVITCELDASERIRKSFDVTFRFRNNAEYYSVRDDLLYYASRLLRTCIPVDRWVHHCEDNREVFPTEAAALTAVDFVAD